MIKRIKIVNHDDHCVRDTTIGKVYEVAHDEVEDTLYFFDDVGDDVMIRVSNPAYKVVGEDQSMTNNNQVNWDEIPEDVEAVIIYEGKCTQLLKTVEGILKYRRVGELEYTTSCWYSTLDEREKCISHYRDGTATLIRRPPAITTPEVDMHDIFKGVDSNPSISTILQEAQQSILKHHGVTGKVKFTVEYSE